MDAEPKGREKRRSERLRVSSCEKLWNLSEGGAFVITAVPRRLGSVFRFEIKLGAKKQTFKALAKVIRVLYKPNPKIGEPAGMAIQFVETSVEDQQILQVFLKECKFKVGPGAELPGKDDGPPMF